MSDRYKIDYQDSKVMWDFAMTTCQVAEDYAESRALYSENLRKLKVALAKAYGNNSIERKIAEDKAYLVLADKDEELRQVLMIVIEQEGVFKGLEQVIAAREHALSFNQSLIKNEPKR